jgi:hypothetical protein
VRRSIGHSSIRSASATSPALCDASVKGEPRGANLGVNLARRALQASQLRTSGFLRLSAGPGATGWCELGCDGVRRQVRTRRSRKSQGFRGFRRIGCEPQCDGCDGQVRTLQGPKLPEFCGFQALSATGGCELRTRIPGLSLANYRAAPPRISIRQGRTGMILPRSSINVHTSTGGLLE